MSNPSFPMRNIIHNKAKRFIMFALMASVGSGISWYTFYTEPRRKNYEKFFRDYDPYVRMKEICDYPVKYLHTCPSILLKRAEEKGLKVEPLHKVYQPPKHLMFELEKSAKFPV